MNVSESKAVRTALERRWRPESHAYLTEYSGSGWGGRRIDFLIVGLWPSRGYHLTAIEVKSTRSDWLREVRDPGKADVFFGMVDFFCLLTTRKDIVVDGEIPENWGWLTLENGRLRTKKKAPAWPTPSFDRSTVAGLLKRYKHEHVDAELRRMREELGEELRQEMMARAEDADPVVRRLRKDLDSLSGKVAEFEKASGVQIAYGWDLGNVGAAVKAVAVAIHDGQRIADQADFLSKQVGHAIADLQKANEEVGRLCSSAPEEGER